MKKCRFAIWTEPAFENLFYGRRICHVRGVGIHFGSIPKWIGSILSQVSVPVAPVAPPRPFHSMCNSKIVYKQVLLLTYSIQSSSLSASWSCNNLPTTARDTKEFI